MVGKQLITITVVALSLAAALSAPIAASAQELASVDAVIAELANTAATNLPDSGAPIGAEYLGSVTKVESIPEYLTGISFTDNQVIIEDSKGKALTVAVDPQSVGNLFGGSMVGGRSAKSELFAWSAIALILINVASAFFRMITNARRAFARRTAVSTARQAR